MTPGREAEEHLVYKYGYSPVACFLSLGLLMEALKGKRIIKQLEQNFTCTRDYDFSKGQYKQD